MNTDLLDEYCQNMYGHTDWSIDWQDGNQVVTFFQKARPEYLELNQGEDE
jgi:hypothetical protein